MLSQQKILLSANRALQDTVTPGLRGVTVDYTEDILTLRAYFDPGASENEKELLDIALTEMMADFPEIRSCKYEAIELPFPAKMSLLKEWVYLRDGEPR